MKRDLPAFIMHTLTVMLLGSIVVVGWVQNGRLRKERDALRTKLESPIEVHLNGQEHMQAWYADGAYWEVSRTGTNTNWEQLYRDCQAARQFSEPAHTADAVQPTITQ